MQLNPYLNFDGNCAEAFRFYEKALGGRIDFLQTHGESPMKDQVAPEWRDRVIHVRLSVGDKVLMGSDMPPGEKRGLDGMCVMIGVDTVAEAERLYKTLVAGGRETMPFGKTFWSPGFGMLTDRFGTPWMVNTEQPA